MIAAYRWDSNWKVSVLLLILLPLLLSLGNWQLQRAEEKRQLQQLYDAQRALPPLPVVQLSAVAEARYRRILLRGHYDNRRSVLLDNRTQGGIAGYHVLSPFVASDGRRFLVNRGWLAGGGDRRQLPSIPAVDGEVELLASVYVPLGAAFVLQHDQWREQWPLVVQWEDIARLEQRFDGSLFPYSLRLEPNQVGALTVDWQPINTRPEKHSGYALQWFSMAAALLIFWLCSSLQRREQQ